MAKLIEKISKNIIPVYKMQDGEIAIIKSWTDSKFEGYLVQRYGFQLIRLGKGINCGWRHIPFGDTDTSFDKNLDKCIVEVLHPGDRITIEI